MNWTTQKPTKPGTYFYRRKPSHDASRFEIQADEDGDLWVYIGDSDFSSGPLYTYKEGEWHEYSISVGDVRQEVEKLLSLLNDPQPGIMTWGSFMSERLRNISDIRNMGIVFDDSTTTS